MTNCIIYTRVSTRAQGESGLGLEAQLVACRAQARAEGWDIAARYQGVVSGSTPLEGREGLLAAISALGMGDVLLVAKRDRVARDPMVMGMVEHLVEKAGARLVSAAGEGTSDDDPASVLMRRIIDAFGEYERVLIGFRTKAALQARKDSGRAANGRPPYGMRVGPRGILVKDPTEQEVIRLINVFGADDLALRAIARQLEARGLHPRAGGSWDPKQIQRILKQEV